MTVHIPVLAGELVEALDPAPGEVAVDCTFGGGGHARLIAERIGPAGTLIGIDRDPEAQARFEEMAAEVSCHTRFIRASFAEGLELLRDEGVGADIVYLDLGMSSMQVDTRERGFSYAYDAPLDMRMDSDQELTAHEIVNTWEARQLTRAFRDFGEERYAPQIARSIVRHRPLETTNDLVEAIVSAVPAPARFAGGHPAKRVFQALRIVVNDELTQIDEALPLVRGGAGGRGREAVAEGTALVAGGGGLDGAALVVAGSITRNAMAAPMLNPRSRIASGERSSPTSSAPIASDPTKSQSVTCTQRATRPRSHFSSAG